MKWILPIFLLILFELIADILAKSWSIKGGTIFATGALIAYFSGNVFWLFALKDGSGIAKGSVIFSVISATLAIALGVIFYKESLTKLQYFGLFLGLISIVLIFWNKL